MSDAVRRQRWRLLKDRITGQLVRFGGVGVIFAVLLIFFYLVYVVLPLFKPAETEQIGSYAVPGDTGSETVYLATDERAEMGTRYTRNGQITFFNAANGAPLRTVRLALPDSAAVASFSAGAPASGVVAYGLSNGHALVVRTAYDETFSEDGRRSIKPRLEYPLGEAALPIDPKGHALAQVAIQEGEDGATIAGVTDDQRATLVHFQKSTSFLDESVTLERQQSDLDYSASSPVAHLLLGSEQRKLYLISQDGELTYFDISDKQKPIVVQRLNMVPQSVKITALAFLSGGTSLLAGDSLGRIVQWFPVRDQRGTNVLTPVRQFESQSAPIRWIAPEYQRKGFLAADESGRVGIYHATAHRTLKVERVVRGPLRNVAVAPRANAMLVEDGAGRLHAWRVHNEHPEVSWSSLWGKVWYENYQQPDYVWQSSSGASDFEPKFSLTPLSFGTLKAAFYAMLLAMPLAILGAIFTAYFMAPRMRGVVKPSIEIMEALPTVILGFLAGLWLAPFVEANLPGIFIMLMAVPMGIIGFAYLWYRLPARVRFGVPYGWEAALLVPVVVILAWAALGLSPAIEATLFGGDMRNWLTNEMGIDFDQRNALVVGLAMGFAVIPNIYSIAEDSIFSVPKHLTQGSLALGATPWQTLWRVVLPTASPAMFSAVMIGLGRAVGETMIVLMATGNTPIMDASIFQGMRTLSANLAVEMPETEVHSTHYRVLFLAALVLFMFTFFFNTIAEVVRQRLRKKYSSL